MRHLFLFSFLTILIACNSETPEFEDFENEFVGEVKDCKLIDGWLVPPAQVVGGGVGKEGIPSLENPNFVTVEEVDFLNDNDLVVGMRVNDEIRLFPHRVIDRHEIVNDQVGDHHYTLTFCPLTGSTVSLDRNSTTSFGVSGLLHNSNLVYYNREDDSFWSQMRLVSIHGEDVCTGATTTTHLEMAWKDWKVNFPDAKVLSINTGFDRDYTTPAFSDAIRESDSPLWPYSPKDTRLKNYEKVLVTFIDNQPKVYPLNEFNPGGEVIKDNVGGHEVFVVGDPSSGLVTAFFGDGISNLQLSADGNGRAVFSNGLRWDLFGNPKGAHDAVEVVPSYIAYWFSVGAMFPNVEIYDGDGD